MNANSKGSVTPQTKAQMAAEPTRPKATLRRSGLALRIMAAAAPGIPNIMQGKKPDMYMPRSQLISVPMVPMSPVTLPAQKLDRSPRPMVSNQKTLLRA